MATVQCNTAGQGGEHGLLFHSFRDPGIPHARMMFGGRLPRQQAHELGKRLLRFRCLCQYDPCSGHTSVVGPRAWSVHEAHIALYYVV